VGILVTGNDSDHILMRDAYEAYLTYCKLRSAAPVTQRKFNSQVVAAGAKRYRTHGSWHLQGVKFDNLEKQPPTVYVDSLQSFYLPHPVQFAR
jgi:hypothetical protein